MAPSLVLSGPSRFINNMAQQSKKKTAAPVPVDPQPTPKEKANDPRYQHNKDWSAGENTSESDSLPIGISPYEDTFCRLDGGKDHKQIDQQFHVRT